MAGPRSNHLPGIVLLTLILSMLAGCGATPFRTHSQLQEKVQAVKTVAVMSPNLKVYRLNAEGGTELLGKETQTAKQVVAVAVEKALERREGVVFKPLPSPPAELEAELEDTQALFETVSASVLLHSYGVRLQASDWRTGRQELFTEKRKDFEYSLGPEVGRLAKLAGADALLFVSGVDHHSTAGRTALRLLLQALLTFGQPSRDIMPAGLTTLSVALVDAATGVLLWYNVVGGGDGYKLTDPASASFLAEWVFEKFPVGSLPAPPSWPSGPGSR